MGPWGPPETGTRRSAQRQAPQADARVLVQIYFAIVTLSLIALAAGALVLQRYEASQIGGVPTRLDRLTGELIGCVPARGCFVIVPAGEPPLGTLRLVPNPPKPATAAPAPAPAAPAPASPPPAKK